MLTQQLYMNDAYLTECESEVVDVSTIGKQKTIILDRTIMQPSHRDGGDRGYLVPQGGTNLYISTVVMDPKSRNIEHRSKANLDLQAGTQVHCQVDWDTRYKLMRKHTGNHLLYGCAKALLKTRFPALSKTSIGETYTRWIGQAASIDEPFIVEVFKMANELIREQRRVIIETLPREAALEKCGRYHESILPESARELRIVTIEDLDSDPCIGLHTRNIEEIHGIKFLKFEKEGSDAKVLSEVI